jgi:hypothetical protein
VFTDIDNIEPNLDFVKAIEDAVIPQRAARHDRQAVAGAVDSEGGDALTTPFRSPGVARVGRFAQNTPMPELTNSRGLTFLTRRQAFEITTRDGSKRPRTDQSPGHRGFGSIRGDPCCPGSSTQRTDGSCFQAVSLNPLNPRPRRLARERHLPIAWPRRLPSARAAPYLLLVIFGLMLATSVALLNSYSFQMTGAACSLAIIGMALKRAGGCGDAAGDSSSAAERGQGEAARRRRPGRTPFPELPYPPLCRLDGPPLAV